MVRDYFVYPGAINASFIVRHWLSIAREIWKFLGKKLHAALHYARIAGYALHRNAKERIGRILRVPWVSRKAASPSFHQLSRPKRKPSHRKNAHTRELYIHTYICTRVSRHNKDVVTRINAYVCLRCKLVFSAITFVISNESTRCHPSIEENSRTFSDERTPIPRGIPLYSFALRSHDQGVYIERRVVAPSNQQHKHFVLFHSHRSVLRV